MIRALQEETGDVVVVATVADDRAVRRPSRSTRSSCSRTTAAASAQKGKDNGAADPARGEGAARRGRGRLRPRAVDHRRLRRRDQPRGTWRRSFASRPITATGLLAGTERIVGRIAQGARRHARPACARRADLDERATRRRSACSTLVLALHRVPHHQPHRRRRRGGAGASGAAAGRLVERRRSVRRRLRWRFGGSAAEVAASAAASADSAAAEAAAVAAAPVGRMLI